MTRARRLATAALLALVLAAFDASAQRIRDDLGREMEPVGVGRRVVALSPFLAESVVAIGGLAELVGVSEFSDFPPDVRRLPRVASASGIDWERLVALGPAVVFAWKDSLREGDLERFERAGLRVFVLSGRRLDDVPRTIRAIARVMGRSSAPAAEAFEGRIRQLRAEHAGRRAVTALVEISHRPLITIGGEHFINDALAVCGARNALAGLPGVAPEAPWELVMAKDPQAIVGAGAPEGEEAFRARWKEHATLAAVRTGALVYVDADHLFRPGPRLADGVAQLCRGINGVRLQLS